METVVPEEFVAVGSFELNETKANELVMKLASNKEDYETADIVCMLMHVYEQNKTILAHIAGIERAFREVAETTTEAMGMLDGPLGGLIAKVMGRS